MPRRAAAGACLTLAALLLLSGIPAAVAAPPTQTSVRDLVRQGSHYSKKHRWTAAIDVLEKAVAQPEGQDHFKAHMLLARAYYETLVLERAFPMAERAVELADDEDDERGATRFRDVLSERFGGVTFRKAPEQKGALKGGLIHLEDRGGLIDPKKKKLFARIAERFRETPVTLPITLYLPFGSYAANRAPFSIEKGKVAEVELILYTPEAAPVVRWPTWAAAGGTALALASGVTLFVLANSADQKAKEIAATPGGDRNRWDEEVARSDSRLLGANISFVAAGALAVAGGVLLTLDLLHDEAEEDGDDSPAASAAVAPPATWAVRPLTVPRGGGLSLTLDF